MTLVLRKSHGPFSANTPVTLEAQEGDIAEVRTARRVPVEFEHIQSYSQFDKPKSIIKRKDHATFSVPIADVVQLKEVTHVGIGKKNALVVSKNRKERRKTDPMVIAKRMAYEGRTQ